MVHLGVNNSSMATDQCSDPEVQSLKTGVMRLKLVDVMFDEAGILVLCDVLLGLPHPVPSFCTQK